MYIGLIFTLSPVAGLKSPAGMGTMSIVTVDPGIVSVKGLPPGSTGFGGVGASAPMLIATNNIRNPMQKRDIQRFSRKTPLAIPLAALIVAIAAGGCSHHRPTPPPLQRHEFSQVSMGVQVRMVVYAIDESHARNAARAAYDRVNLLDEIMSDYQRD